MSVALKLRTCARKILDDQKVKALRRFQAKKFRRLQHTLYRFLFGSNLELLSTIYGGDKWEWYIEAYDRHFSSLRRKKLNILEIGIGGYDDPEGGGSSLRMWRTYFPNAQIYGVDIFDKSSHDETRIRTFKGSQIDPEFLDRVLMETGPLDIVIDDGSHRNEHILFTFQYLFPRISENALYVIEDLQTSYWQSYGGSSDNLCREDTSMGYLKSLIDCLNYAELERACYHPTYYDRHIVAMHFYHSLAFIQKGLNDGRGGGEELGRMIRFQLPHPESV
ncbi:MAG: tylE [Nitrospira sp.]|jgi:demethylmacrocin O-methyltransferase|nr:tylE [Nitrospira sp.]